VRPIFLACLLLALPALIPSAQAWSARPVPGAPTDTVQGTVVDSTGAPVARADVSLLELGRRTLTDAQGRFALGAVPAGRYTLVATGPGYPSVARPVTVPLAEALVVRLTGEPSLLPPVTVTATRSPLDPRLSPLPATELSGDALRRSTSVSLARAVEELPGLRTLSTGEQIGKPVIRGLSGPRVLVLDNGLRLEDYSWSDEDGPSVDARLADRVEVIRGPASVLYGSDAVGGVINVLPADLPRADAGGTVSRFRSEVFGASNNVEGGALLGFEGAKGGLGARATVIGRTAGDLHTPGGELDNTGFSAVNGELAVGASGVTEGRPSATPATAASSSCSRPADRGLRARPRGTAGRSASSPTIACGWTPPACWAGFGWRPGPSGSGTGSRRTRTRPRRPGAGRRRGGSSISCSTPARSTCCCIIGWART